MEYTWMQNLQEIAMARKVLFPLFFFAPSRLRAFAFKKKPRHEKTGVVFQEVGRSFAIRSFTIPSQLQPPIAVTSHFVPRISRRDRAAGSVPSCIELANPLYSIVCRS
jgi:hypothetical protein